VINYEGQINVAIVGVGGAGQAHIDYFNSIEGVNVKALLDPQKDLLEKVVQRKNLNDIFITAQYDQILELKDINVISICSPDQTHFEYSSKALYAGKHVLCEKPMVTSISECEQLINIVEKTGLVFTVQHQMRFVPLFSTIESIICSGQIGLPFVLEADYLHDLRKRANQYDSWRLDPANYHPPFLGGGCHFIDLFRWYTKSEVKEIFSYANNLSFKEYPEADTVMTILKFENNCIGKILTSFACKRPMDFPIKIYGTKGTLVNNLMFIDNQIKKIIYEPPIGKKAKLILWMLQYLNVPYKEFPFDLYEHKLACRNSVLDFITAVRTGRKPLVDVYEGAKTVIVCVAGTESYRKNKPVQITGL